ncbi:hypothetical protein RRF57_002400 [Xylaria bambusicola]|uniref:Uncharacterized protein n=1 Tax=Xylaria bambusicola TaxID=326684 RepID=A0AAN7U696_9PEZI
MKLAGFDLIGIKCAREGDLEMPFRGGGSEEKAQGAFDVSGRLVVWTFDNVIAVALWYNTDI